MSGVRWPRLSLRFHLSFEFTGRSVSLVVRVHASANFNSHQQGNDGKENKQGCKKDDPRDGRVAVVAQGPKDGNSDYRAHQIFGLFVGRRSEHAENSEGNGNERGRTQSLFDFSFGQLHFLLFNNK